MSAIVSVSQFLFVACDNGVEANGSDQRSDTTTNKVSRLSEVRAESCAILHLWLLDVSWGFQGLKPPRNK